MVDFKQVDIFNIAERLGLEPKRKSVSNSVDYVCPFCGDENGHLNIRPAPKNMWRCNLCEAGGGVLKLVMETLNCSKNDAIDFINENDSKIDESIYKNNYENDFKYYDDEKIASPEVLNNTYRTMIKLLNTYPHHIEDLKNRGLSLREINGFGLKSVPTDSDVYIPYKLIQAGCILDGVPGFYQKYGKDQTISLIKEYINYLKNEEKVA